MSHRTQQAFAKALIDVDAIVPTNLRCWYDGVPSRRFDVYRNNVASSLVRALASRFFAVEMIVGAEFFGALAQAYIRQCPPRSPLMLRFGDDFAAFLERFEPAASVPYLADVARVEAARSQAYHAEDRKPMAIESLGAVEPEHLVSLRFAFHPSCHLVRSSYPVHTIWAMNAGELPLSPVEDWSGQDVLIVRPDMLVNTIKLPAGGAAFLAALVDGADLRRAIKMAQDETIDFDMSFTLGIALQNGIFIKYF